MIRKNTLVFDFNHIDSSIPEEEKQKIKNLYKYYHKLWWRYKNTFKHFKHMSLALNLASSGLIAIGAVVGGVTLNPIALGVLSGFGLLLKTTSEMKNYKNKIEMAKFAFMKYEEILVELRSCLRGNNKLDDAFLNELTIIDEMICNLVILKDNEKDYDKLFKS